MYAIIFKSISRLENWDNSCWVWMYQTWIEQWNRYN